MRISKVACLLLSGLLLLPSGCGWLNATGESVESVGEGAGHAVSETGRAVGGAADETEDELDAHLY